MNPTGPLHAGGGRWVAVGDAIANLLAAQGAVVHREYYLNDAGNQLDTFGASLYARYAGHPLPEDGYQGAYLVDMAERMRAELGDDVTEERGAGMGPRRRRRAAAGRPRPHRRALRHLVLRAHAARARARSARCSSGCRPAGSPTSRTAPRGCGAEELGDQRDRVLVKSRRQHHLPAATTSRTTATRSSAGWEHLIDIWGADHHGQVKSLQVGMRALGIGTDGRAGARDHPRSVRDARARRRDRPALEAHRQHHHARRHPRRGRSRRRAA